MPSRLPFAPSGRAVLDRRAESWRVGPRENAWTALRILREDKAHSLFVSLTATVDRLGREIRERKRVEQELQAAMKRALAASRAKDDLLAHVSHDLRTPLNAIIGFSELMQSEPFGALGEKYHPYLRDIKNSGRTLLEFVERMLAVVADDRAAAVATYACLVDLSNCLDSVRKICAPLAEKKGLRLLVPADLTLPQIRADQALIEEILLNLLTNAISYTPEGGRVRVNSRWRQDGAVELCIRDTGVGMKPEEIETFSQPFHRGRDPYIAGTQGYGLGLSSAYNAASALGAEIYFDSVPGKGTLVRVCFPGELIEPQPGR